MTPDSPDFLEASGGSLSPAELAALVAAWRNVLACLERAYRIMGDSAESVAYWRAYCERQVEEGGDLQAAHARTLAAACGDPPAPICPTCTRNQGDGCEWSNTCFHPAWYANDGNLGGVKCPGRRVKTAGDAK